MGALGPEPHEHPALRRLVVALWEWRAASPDAACEGALRRYCDAAAALIERGVTLYDLDPMDMLPDNHRPLVWQEAYAEAFAGAVDQRQDVVAVD